MLRLLDLHWPSIPDPSSLLARLALMVLLAAGLSAAFLVLSGQPIGAALASGPGAGEKPGEALWSGFFPAGWSNDRPLSSGVVVSDPAGLDLDSAAYRTSTNGGASWTGWNREGFGVTSTISTTADLVVSGLDFPDSQTQNLIQFRIRPLIGVTSTSPGYVIAVDTAPPGPPFGLQSWPANWTHSDFFTETWFNPSDLSGIAGAYYLLDREPTFATDGLFVATTNIISNIHVQDDGAHNIFIWLQDGAGNVTHLARNVDVGAFRYDSRPPSVAVELDGPLGKNGWYTAAVTANFSPQDQPGLSGVAAWGWQLDGQTRGDSPSIMLADDLVHSLVVTATDVAGNVAPPTTHTIALDSGAPFLTHTVAPAPGPAGWYTAALTVTLALSDPLSGPDLIYWQLDQGPVSTLPPWWPFARVTVEDQGAHLLVVYGEDLAGNRSSTLNLNLPLDSQAPASTATITPEPAASGYYTAAVDVLVTAEDATSGVDATWLRVDQGDWQRTSTLTLVDDGHYELDYYSVDVAGNREPSRTFGIALDATAPAAPLAPQIEPAGWSASNRFTLRWQNPGDLSGIAAALAFIGEGPPAPGQGVFFPLVDPWAPFAEINDLAVPGEGTWPVWLWLADGAGNRDHASALQAGLMRHDATPPSLTVDASGPAGNAGWFTGPVTVTLTLADEGSGPDRLHYRLDGSPWQSNNQAQITLIIDEAGKHVLDTYGQDIAGHIVGPQRATVRIDSDPPGLPIRPTVVPDNWTNTNQFTITWRNPLDSSGVGLAYTSLTPPSGPRRGQPWPAAAGAVVLEVPAEGAHDLYLWLEDVAGNVDVAQAVTMPQALRYDATPPTTTVTFNAEPNAAGWFRSGVAVTLVAEDAFSGVATTTWQLDDGLPVAGNWLFVTGDGTHTLRVFSTDRAGNVEDIAEYAIAIDTLAPVADLYPLAGYSTSPNIHVRWAGTDLQPGPAKDYVPGSSGVSGYDVEVRLGVTGDWQPWLTGTSATEANFPGDRGQLYAFRVRAIDLAGNRSAWAEAGQRNRVLVDPVANGFFQTQNWNGWETQDTLDMALIEETQLYSGTVVPVGRLGSTRWLACAKPGDLPTLLCGDDWSSIAQTLTVPSPAEVARPTLNFWYHVQTYDVITTSSPIWSSLCPQLDGPPFLADTFDVTAQVAGTDQVDLLWRDGNPLPQFNGSGGQNPPIPFRDLGWRRASLDMTSYAGQEIRLEFANHNRLDERFNTWTDVYGIRLSDMPRQIFLPLVTEEASVEPQPLSYCYPLGEPLSTPMTALPTPDVHSQGGIR